MAEDTPYLSYNQSYIHWTTLGYFPTLCLLNFNARAMIIILPNVKESVGVAEPPDILLAKQNRLDFVKTD